LYCLVIALRVIALRCGGIVKSRLGFVVVFVLVFVSVSVSFSLYCRIRSALVLPLLLWSSLVLTRYTKLRFPSPISVTIKSAHVIVSSPPTRIAQSSGWHSTYALTCNTRQSEDNHKTIAKQRKKIARQDHNRTKTKNKDTRQLKVQTTKDKATQHKTIQQKTTKITQDGTTKHKTSTQHNARQHNTQGTTGQRQERTRQDTKMARQDKARQRQDIHLTFSSFNCS
jgi:hypothetical protein